jgi:antitoxin StbD
LQPSEVVIVANPNPSIKSIMNSLIPITRFNRGEANKIFDEVSVTGVKIVLKNNVPVGVILAPEQYEAMIELLEDYALFFEAEKRLKSSGAEETVTQDQLMHQLGISESDLDDIEVDIE